MHPPRPDPAAAAAECVRVVVRCRPLNSRELADGRARIVDVDRARRQVLLRSAKGGDAAPGAAGSQAAAAAAAEPPKAFTFDAVFDWESSQADVYEDTAASIVASALRGYNGTVFAYGQTGTGKTHTMEGYSGSLGAGGDGGSDAAAAQQQAQRDARGIIPRAFEHIFAAIEASSNTQYLVRASFLEIYNEEVRDLLSKSPKERLELKEHKDSGVYVKGLNSFVVKSVDEIRHVLEVGKKNRSVGATLMNQDSSRSHSVFSITVETIQQGPTSDGHIRVGKLHLVDLAGSERQSKTGATGDRLKEATKINLSLSALGNVISALVDGKSGHIPYRDSKLTRLLQDSLGGNTKTVMVANIGPADWNYEETLSTLRYANRAKSITNKPRVNEDPKDALLKEFQDEISRLRAALQAAEAGGADSGLLADGEGRRQLEKVVQVPRALDPQELDRLKQEVASQLQVQLAATTDGQAELTPEQLVQVSADAEAAAAAEAARLEAAARAAEADAARYERKQKAVAQKMARAAAESEQLHAQKRELAARLAAMESKILQGEAGGGLLEVARRQEQQLAAREQELQRRRAEEAAAAAEIARAEEEALLVNRQASSLAEAAADTTRKLRRLWRKYQEVDDEVAQLYSEFQGEREELLDGLRLLGQQLALKDAVIAAFVPQEEVDRVLQRATWDDDTEAWVLEPRSSCGSCCTGGGGNSGAAAAGSPTGSPSSPARGRTGRRTQQQQQQQGQQGQQQLVCGVMPHSGRPIAVAGARRPTSNFTRAAALSGDMNPRFRCENILALELDVPQSSTYNFIDGQAPDPRAQAAIDAGFWQDGTVLLLGPPGSPQQQLHLGTASLLDGPGCRRRTGDVGQQQRPSSARAAARRY